MAGRTRSFASLLSGGDLRSTGRVAVAVEIVGKDESRFGELLRELWNQDRRIAMRAADAVEKSTRDRHQLLYPFKAELLGLAEETIATEVQWHCAQILPRLRMSARDLIRVRKIMARYRQSDSAIVRTFALQGLFDLSRENPQMRLDVIEQLEAAVSSGSAAERARARKLLAAAKQRS